MVKVEILVLKQMRDQVLKKKSKQMAFFLTVWIYISQKNTNTIKSREIRIRTWLEGRGNKLLSLRCCLWGTVGITKRRWSIHNYKCSDRERGILGDFFYTEANPKDPWKHVIFNWGLPCGLKKKNHTTWKRGMNFCGVNSGKLWGLCEQITKSITHQGHWGEIETV